MSRRIGITTTQGRGKELAAIVVAKGCEPVLLPCIRVFPHADDVLDRARQLAESADRIIITSPRTVSTLWPDGDMPGVPVAAVGNRTAEKVEAAGGTVAMVGDGGFEALSAGLLSDWTHFRVFFPHGDAADTTTLQGDVVTMSVYDTSPIPPTDEPVDAVIFGSPSAVTGWVMSRALDDMVIGAIGSTTAQALTNQGHPPQILPDRPDYETLIDLVADSLTDRSLV